MSAAERLEPTEAKCDRCGLTKPISEFQGRKSWLSKDGPTTACKECRQKKYDRSKGTITEPRKWPKGLLARSLPILNDNGLARPLTRAECEDGPRPCPWVSCQYNLLADVRKHKVVDLYDESVDVDDYGPSCALDIADAGEHSLEDIASVMGITRDAVRQIEFTALRKLEKTDIGRALREFAPSSPGFEHRKRHPVLSRREIYAPDDSDDGED